MTLRQPQAYVVINGAQYPVTSVEVMQSRTKNSDTFWCEIPLELIGDVTGKDVTAQVYMGNDQVADTLMFDGYVDNVSISFDHQVVTLNGRDKIKKMIDKKSRQGFLNKKPDDIVNQLAGSAGLSVNSDGLSSKAGKIYKQDFNAFLHDISDWSMVCKLADQFGLSAYATLGTIYIKQMPESLPVYQINYVPPTSGNYADGDFISLHCTHNLIVDGGATVNVHSWNHKSKKKISATSSSGSGPTYDYSATPGLTQDQAQNIAKKRLYENTAPGRTVSLTVPGDVTMNVRTDVQITGTGTSFDDTFETESVEFRMDCGSGESGDTEGFVMSLSAKAKGKSG